MPRAAVGARSISDRYGCHEYFGGICGSGVRQVGKRWTDEEDALIKRAAYLSRIEGRRDGGARLREVANKIGRSYAAVRTRASRIRAHSYRPFNAEALWSHATGESPSWKK